MKSRYPIKKLSVFNLWLTSYFLLFGFVITMANQGKEGLEQAIRNSLIGAFILILNSFINLALLVYFENRITLSKTKGRKKYLFLSYSLSFLVYLLVIAVFSLFKQSHIQLISFLFVIIICILINTLILALQNSLIMHDAKVASDIENSKLKATNADAANQLLRQQIHPHFLFNALNILKSLYKVNPHTGEEYLIRLSDFLRAAVSNNNIKVISLKDELKLCEDYLEMQKIRFNKALSCNISVSEKTLKTGFVPSFSIQPLLENAIKHNELTEEFPLNISIQQLDDRIKITNNIRIKKTSEASAGSGLANLSERYRLISDDELIIDETDNTFSVSIKILSHEDSNH